MSLIRKRKLSKNQNRQIQRNNASVVDDGSLATGVIVAHFGKQLDVQITALPTVYPADHPTPQLGDIWRCHARTNLPMLTTGDEVKFSLDMVANLGLIQTLTARRTLISRPDRYHKLKPVAANADILVIVFAPLPKPATSLIDRYLLVAKLSNLTPLLVLNKADLLDDFSEVQEIYKEYQELGSQYHFDIIQTSNTTKDGISALQQRIQGKLAIFAGQSGVGKSSLINQILPSAKQATKHISTNSQLGQHTTTTSRLLPYNASNLAQGGIIDTPGIREYGVWHLRAEDILVGFEDLQAAIGQCRFRDCTHQQHAKGCALWQQANEGQIKAWRIHSFNELVSQSRQSQANFHKN